MPHRHVLQFAVHTVPMLLLERQRMEVLGVKICRVTPSLKRFLLGLQQDLASEGMPRPSGCDQLLIITLFENTFDIHQVFLQPWDKRYPHKWLKQPKTTRAGHAFLVIERSAILYCCQLIPVRPGQSRSFPVRLQRAV